MSEPEKLRVLATIVLAAGVAGRVEVAKRMVALLQDQYPEGGVALPPKEEAE